MFITAPLYNFLLGTSLQFLTSNNITHTSWMWYATIKQVSDANHSTSRMWLRCVSDAINARIQLVCEVRCWT